MSSIEITVREGAGSRRVALGGALTRHTVSRAFAELDPLLSEKQPLEIDLGGVGEIDSAGVALIAYAFDKLGVGPGGCTLESVGDDVARQLDLAGWDYSADPEQDVSPRQGFAESLGEETASAGSRALYFLFVLSEIFYRGVVAPFKGDRPRARIFVQHLSRLGAGSAPIVLLVALLVGLTTAFQSAYQLRQFGANIYVADLVAISMMLELGPLMAAILVAGRCGAAITAEIGTMQVTEEIDALKLIGINPIQYLAVPRVYAVAITQPLLGVSAAVVGILGGMVIALFYLDVSIIAFTQEAIASLVFGDVVHNVVKSMVFGIVIMSVAVFYGLRVKGGAEGVGRATTNSVVTSIFMIIVVDCAFSFT
ncbi:MAG: MlaE family lipid ABC transporter permease subunit [Polyangia bacterium]